MIDLNTVKAFEGEDIDGISEMTRRCLEIRYAHLASYCFCPLTELVGDRVVLFNNFCDPSSDEQKAAFLDAIKTDPGVIDSFNYVELDYCFPWFDSSPDDAILSLYDKMMDSWHAWLHYQYPDRRFDVYLEDDGPDTSMFLGFREIRT